MRMHRQIRNRRMSVEYLVIPKYIFPLHHHLPMKTAILLIAHGAKESEGKDSASKNRVPLMEATGMDVYLAYLHLEPSVHDTVRRMMDDGVDRIIAVPLFVFPGFLPDVTVRKAVGLEPRAVTGMSREGDGCVRMVFTGTFGDHPLMEDVILDVCGGYGAKPENTSVIMVFHGNRNGSGTENVDRCSRYLSGRGYDVISAYNEFQSPTVEEAVGSLSGKGRDILVIPMFVSPGTHTTSDIPVKLGLNGSDTRDLGNGHILRYAPEIGMHPRIADILKARVDETLKGQ